TLARITFGVLVGQYRTLCLQHARARVVLRGDQLDVLLLARPLGIDGARQVGVKSLDRHRLGIHGTAGSSKKAHMLNTNPGQAASWDSTTAFHPAAMLPRS